MARYLPLKSRAGPARICARLASFAAAVRAQFLPRDVEDWALQERDALVAHAAKNRNVLDYTAKFEELDQLLPGESARSTVSAYARGLPEAYAIKCAERRFASLAEATAAMTTRWHAKEGAHHTASVSNAEAVTPACDDSASSPSPQGADSVEELRAQVAQLTAMMSERFSQSARGRGRPGRGGGRTKERGEGERRERSHTPGITSDIARARIRAGQCIKCGQEGHFKQSCTNEVKLN